MSKSLSPVVFPSSLLPSLTHEDRAHSSEVDGLWEKCCILLEHNQRMGFPSKEPRVVSRTHARTHTPHSGLTVRRSSRAHRPDCAALTAAQHSRERLHVRSAHMPARTGAYTTCENDKRRLK